MISTESILASTSINPYVEHQTGRMPSQPLGCNNVVRKLPRYRITQGMRNALSLFAFFSRGYTAHREP